MRWLFLLLVFALAAAIGAILGSSARAAADGNYSEYIRTTGGSRRPPGAILQTWSGDQWHRAQGAMRGLLAGGGRTPGTRLHRQQGRPVDQDAIPEGLPVGARVPVDGSSSCGCTPLPSGDCGCNGGINAY